MTNTGVKFKYITIRQEGLEEFEGHPIYRVFNNKSGEQLAILSWYKPWKQYVFSSREECVFNHECLSDETTVVSDDGGARCARVGVRGSGRGSEDFPE